MDYQEHARQQSELAGINAFKAIQAKRAKAQKAKKSKKSEWNKLSGDFNIAKPNVLKVTARFSNKGTALFGFEQNGKEWRFGKPLSQLHPKTVITVESGAIYELPTASIYEYIKENKPIWLDGMYSPIHKTKSYQIQIHDLVEYCGSKAGYSV